MQTTLIARLRAVAERQPDALAVGWSQASWNYGQLLARSEAIALMLAQAGIPPQARVALLLRNSPQYVASYVGILAAGCVAVPLNVQERVTVLAGQIAHCAATVIIGDPAHPEWRELLDSPALATAAVMAWSTAADEAPAWVRSAVPAASSAAAPPAGPPDLATIIYTSGTTGRPKGVMLSHQNLCSNAATIAGYLELSERDRSLCVLPFHFSYGNSVLQSHLWVGASLLLEENLAFPHRTLQRMQDELISGLAGVPSTFMLLLNRCRIGEYQLDALRYITQAGGAMGVATISRLTSALPRTRIFIMYGQTEATARLSYLVPEQIHEKPGSVGKPIPGVEIEVRNASGSQAAPGETGEILARGPNIMLGYWNDPAATAEVLRDGWLHTGDLGRKDADGFLYIDGRAVEMIKVGAFRVSPLEVEEAVAAMEGVLEVAAFGVDDDVLGQAVKVVAVVRTGPSVDPMAVKAWCRQRLAAYKVPKHVELTTTQLPRTASGKVQKYKLS